jgi:prolipoprotein diacylglyceryltransferase
MDFQNPGLVWGLYAAGLLVFGLLYAFSLKKAGLKLLCAPLSVVFGTILAVVGARFFFLVPNLIFNGGSLDGETVFSLRPDEMSFTGGCVGFALGTFIAAKVSRAEAKPALDAMAVPGCILIAFARLAETGFGFINLGEMPAFLPAVWPFAILNGWGLPDLSVSTFMALAALLCALWLTLSKKPAAPGYRFESAAFVLCAVMIFLEMLCTTSSWIPFIISFIHLEQVLCAVILLVLMIRRTVQIKKAGPLIVTVLMLGLNALMQFVQDKPYLFPLPEDSNVALLAVIVFALTTAGLIAAWLWAGKTQSSSSKGS